MKIITKALLLVCIVAISACSSKHENSENEAHAELRKDDYLATLNTLEVAALKDTVLNINQAKKLIKAYSDFAYAFPADTSSPDYLFKAAEVATSIQEYKQALVYYETIVNKYPEYKFSVVSLYLQGHIYDSFLNDDKKAKEIYETVIRSYPDHKFANDAKIQIQNLGKSDEELIEEFKKRNKEAAGT